MRSLSDIIATNNAGLILDQLKTHQLYVIEKNSETYYAKLKDGKYYIAWRGRYIGQGYPWTEIPALELANKIYEFWQKKYSIGCANPLSIMKKLNIL